MTSPYRSAANPAPETARDIHDILRNADDVIFSEVDNFAEIAKLAIVGLRARKAPNPIDMLAVWEYYIDGDADVALRKLPTWNHGFVACREYIVEYLTAFCDKWWKYLNDFLGYDACYDWDFLPHFLGTLEHHDTDKLTLDDIAPALEAVMTNHRR